MIIMSKTIRFSITILGEIEVPNGASHEDILDRIHRECYEMGVDARMANDIEYHEEVDE